MKINDVILENKQLDELTAGQVGTAVGKGVGAVAKGAGAVVGGIAGAGKAFMKGFKGGKAVVGGDSIASKLQAKTGMKGAAGSSSGQGGVGGQGGAGAPGQAGQAGQPGAPGQAAKPAGQTSPQSVNMKAIQDAIAKLPQNQRMSLRAIVAKKAGVK